MKLDRCLSALALTMALVLLLPPTAHAQGLGPLEGETSLTGTNLTYYPKATVDGRQSDCANNPQCAGFTWIQEGTYNASDSAMCYLVSVVTGRSPARGHISAVKGAGGAQPGR